MTTVFIADTGVFVRCGGPANDKFQRLQQAFRRARGTLHVPRRVIAELGGDPVREAYPSGDIVVPDRIDEDWIVVTDELDYATPVVSTVMDHARRFIANETGRDEDAIEKADTALVEYAAQVLDSGLADAVVLLTTDKPAGRAAETVLPRHGFDSIEFQYVGEEYLETIVSDDLESVQN